MLLCGVKLVISGGSLGMGREVTQEGRGEVVAWGTKGTHEWVVGGGYEWRAFLRRGEEGAGREGRARSGGRGEGGNDKGSAPSREEGPTLW